MRVTAEGEDDLWLTCQQCGKSDHFVGDVVQCSCAPYDHTVTPAGTRVEMSGLTLCPSSSPALADLELDPRRLAVFAFVVLLLGLCGPA